MNFAHLIAVQDIRRFDIVEEVHKVTAFAFEDDRKHFHRLFEKEVKLELESFNRWLIHFGGPISYKVQDLVHSWLPRQKDEPDSQLFCIDAGGRNHGIDKAVYVTSNCMFDLISILVLRGNVNYPLHRIHLDQFNRPI